MHDPNDGVMIAGVDVWLWVEQELIAKKHFEISFNLLVVPRYTTKEWFDIMEYGKSPFLFRSDSNFFRGDAANASSWQFLSAWRVGIIRADGQLYSSLGVNHVRYG